MQNTYYKTGEFAKKANVSLRTIRYYDIKNLLKPSRRDSKGYRYYTDQDLTKLQQILLLKYLGFSLKEIREITLGTTDNQFLLDSLTIQRRLVQDKIAEMTAVASAIDETSRNIKAKDQIDWNNLLNIIHLTTNNKRIEIQYRNATNIAARIRLHRDFSTNPQPWFKWIFQQIQLKSNMQILELGCGNGELWKENLALLPPNIEVTLSDISEGMLQDAKKNLGANSSFDYQIIDINNFPTITQKYDLIIANHTLFYSDQVEKVVHKISQFLKPSGYLVASTYSQKHMHEITDLVQEFNKEIYLSDKKLYEIFGLANGKKILTPYFSSINLIHYPDRIKITQPSPLINYILSCHGNQNQLLLDHYQEFYDYVNNKISSGFTITKDAGLFIAKK